jgi:lipopolysaccharide/colanic/teichoic acid biosynthesis glycosyltransferase/glycosyltransferase involved in cell wall biosynthesis
VHVTTVPATLDFLRGQIGYIKSRGFDVWAVSSPGPDLDRFTKEEGIRGIAVEMARRITPMADLFALARLWRVFMRIRPAVVHGHTPKGGLLAMIAAFLAGVPLRAYTVHGLPMETASGWKRRLLRWTERTSCLLAHRVYSVSPSLSRIILEEGLCAPRKLRLLGQGTVNGVDSTHRFVPGAEQSRAAKEVRKELRISPEHLVIGFIGRIVRDKGVPELVEAWSSLRSEFPEAHLVVAGSFGAQDPVTPEVERVLKSDPRVHLMGHVRVMPPVLASMDVVALPTYREGFPQVPLEAAAMERPVVATRVTGCVDAIVDGTTGTLIPARNARALTEAVRAYLRDPQLRLKHGRAARLRVLRDFRPEALWQAMEREYRSGLGAGSGGGGEFTPASESPAAGRQGFRSVEWTVKRIVDICGSVAALAIAAPLMGLIALGTWATLGAPIFFRQTRPGLKGRPFVPLKFRTMRVGAGKDAERVTKLGRLLRHFSLDELPQLWNVLRGDMSLVGPRPLLMAYLGRYSPRLVRRHDMRPGITGWCQVNGRNSLTWDRKFEFDVWYVDNWSLLLDFKILFMTMGRVLRKSGVEGPGNRCWPAILGIGPEGPGVETQVSVGKAP